MGQIVHFGLGNFARAHILDYTADAGGWDVVGVSLRSPLVRDGLAAQDFSYNLSIQGKSLKRISILKDVLVASEGAQSILDAMTTADIISATVTEKGYHLNTNGTLNLEDPAIFSDLAGNHIQTLIGFIAKSLETRTRPITVLSCDNRIENGNALKRAVFTFATAASIEINWQLVSFPNSMVDRITPATTDTIRKISGDPMAVPTEEFREWVIEDSFSGPRPNWPEVQFVRDVRPHELRKLRMLNGAHSLLAYAGLALGHTYVHQAIADSTLRQQVQNLMLEAGATLPPSVRSQVPHYAKALLTRFENPDLSHRLDQIAMDGSQKVPYRFLDTLRAGVSPTVIKGVKAWITFCIYQTSQGKQLNDPKAVDIAKAARSKNPETALLELLGASDLAPLIQG